MYIQSYQIHNVLNVYRRQLSQIKPDQAQQPEPANANSDSANISVEGKYQSIMQKVTDNVLKKITSVDPQAVDDQKKPEPHRQTAGQADSIGTERQFSFRTLGVDNRKKIRSIAVDDSQVLMNRLNELAKAAVNSNAE